MKAICFLLFFLTFTIIFGCKDCPEQVVDNESIYTKDSSVVCYLPFDKSINNLSVYLLAVIPSKITFVSDRNGNSYKAAYFNGSSHITILNDSILQLTKDLTISVWLRPDSGYGIPSQQGYVNFVGMWKNTGPKASSWELQFRVPTKSLIGITHDGNINSLCTSDNTLLELQWTHVSFTFKDGNSKIYVNGELKSNVSAVTPQYTDYDLEIGWQNTNVCLYKGAMDELIIYNRALSETDIKNLAKY